MKNYRFALFGNPVSQSPSPGIHKAFGRQFELDIDYRLIESGAEKFENDLNEFHSGGGHGCNITQPLKHIAFDCAEVHSSKAKLAAAVNTLWWDSENRLNADNTDGTGLVRDIEINLGFSIQDKNVLILGAGGATAGILGAVLACSPARITIANRTVERAHTLARRHQELGDVRSMSLQEVDKASADIVIDSTSVGHSGATPAIPESILIGSKLCYSLNYGSAAQPLRRLCKKLGVPFQGGLGMLVEQAACAFEIWTGLTPQTESVYKDLDYAMK